MNKLYRNILVILIILLAGVYLHKNYINEFPSNTHAWAQADRYALALGFVNNNLNFFKPETFVLNHQFPNDWTLPSNESITAVDFPIHDYIPALIMKISGKKSVLIFRVYILLYSLIGLFFLYKLVMLITDDFIKSVFVVLFALSSPVYVYYQGGFLPTIPSLSNTIIGVFFYTSYLKSSNNRYFAFSILFLSLATLSRTTFAIPLFSIIGIELIKVFEKRTYLKPKIFPVLASLFVIISFYFYNVYLKNEYGSIFLNHFLPAKNPQQAIEIVSIVWEKWLFQYFSKVHYLVFGIFMLIYLITFILKRLKKNEFIGTLFMLIGLMFFGYILFSIVMLKQFANHDYYFLDTFFLPIVLFLSLIIERIPIQQNKRNQVLAAIFVLIVSIPLVLNAHNSQENRRMSAYWDKPNSTINNFKNSSIWLDSLNISKQAKILVIGAYAPNIPFILMERKGYAVMSLKKDNIQEALEWDYDYIAIQNEFFLSDIYSVFPDIIIQIEKIADNGKLSLFIKSNGESEHNLKDFIGISNRTSEFSAIMSYDTSMSKSWQLVEETDRFVFSGTKSGIVKKDIIYGITFKTDSLPIITQKNCLLYFSSYFLHESIGDWDVVVSISANGENIYYNSTNIREILKKPNHWEKVHLTYQLPIVQDNNYEFALFIRNTCGKELYIDDFGFKLY